MPIQNNLSKPAQFSFAADLFMLQAILRSEDPGRDSGMLEYVFPTSCYRQIMGWLLSGAKEIGLEPFEGVAVLRSSGEVRITFPNPAEEDRMHRFFEMFNRRRMQAQGVDPSFPPMPDIYQGNEKPVQHVIERYLYCIETAFDGDSDVVPIPSGPNGEEFVFKCT